MCRQLDNQFGYAHSHSIPLHNAAFGSGVGPIFIDNLACDENEVMINDCTVHGTIGLTECDHSSDAGVTCVGMLMEISQHMCTHPCCYRCRRMFF